MLLQGSYDYRLVALSVVFAIGAAYTALDIAGRIAQAERWARILWLGCGAASMGVGIWAMHYIGMLAFTLPVPMLHHYPTVILSLLAAIAASAVALVTMNRARGVLAWAVGSVAMSAGIVAMHYIGMAAMRMPAMMHYDLRLVALSILLAWATSLAALWLAFRLKGARHPERRKLFSAILMGLAIPLTHYFGMWAVHFHPSAAPFSTRNAIPISFLGVAAITGITLFIFTLAIVTATVDRILAMQKSAIAAARDGESRFRILAEAIPEIVWTATPQGRIDYCNQHLCELTGLTVEQVLQSGWRSLIHDDDRPMVLKAWEEALKSGTPFESEYRLQTVTQGCRWYWARGTPMRDSAGAILRWFGTCTDIEGQKLNQQALEQQIRARTEELAEANSRLHEEMFEKDLARRQLDAQNEHMVQELTERSERATMLAKMGELLQTCISKEEVFAAALGFAPKIFPSSRGAVALLNAGRNLTEIAGSWHDPFLPVPVFEPDACWALRTGHPHLVPAGDTTARCAHAAGVENTYLCIPILAQGEALGILHFQATDEFPTLADNQLSLKTTFAGQVGLSVANIRLREALRSQSIKDPLTGLYNRRYLTEMMERETRRAVRADQPLGVLMIDLDHFKKFNDTYGHDAGDAVLRETASFLGKSIRVEDVVCRFGGEEFVVILPTADVQSAKARAERIRAKIRELTVLHHGHSLGMVTISVGVAALPVNGTSPAELLAAADAALYRAKREGRDRVVAADPPLVTEEAKVIGAGKS